MSVWRQLAEYLYLKKKDPDATRTQWMKYMHGMNRISVIIFVIALLVILFRVIILPQFK